MKGGSGRACDACTSITERELKQALRLHFPMPANVLQRDLALREYIFVYFPNTNILYYIGSEVRCGPQKLEVYLTAFKNFLIKPYYRHFFLG